MKKVLLKSSVILVAIAIVLYLSAYLVIRFANSQDSISNDLLFDKEVWQNGTSRQRGQMVNYLLDSIGIINRSKDEIKAITGNPDDEQQIIDGDYTSRFYYRVDKGHAYVYDMIVFFDSTDHARNVLFDD